MDRCDLRPGEHMYDYVVCIYENDMLILERDGEDVKRKSIQYGEILALRLTEDLLNGILHIYTADYSYKIPFNTISSGLVEKLTEILRTRYINAPISENKSFKLKPSEIELDKLSFFFNRLLNKAEKKHPDMRLLAVQPEVSVKSNEKNLWRRFLFAAIDKRLLESLHIYNGKEMEIINRGRTWKYRWQAVYGKETLFLPLEKIRTVSLEPEKSGQGIRNLIFQTEGSHHTFSFLEENPLLLDYYNSISNKAG